MTDDQQEIKRLRERCGMFQKAHAILLWAFIDLVETGTPKPLSDSDDPMSFPDAMNSINLLNRWRKENKLNIRVADVS